MPPTDALRRGSKDVKTNEGGCEKKEFSCINEATYLASLNSRHGRIVVDNGKVVFYLLLLPERDLIHIRSLNVIVIGLLVLSDPLIICRSLESKRGVGWILHSAAQSVIERLDLAFKRVSVLGLLISVQVDTRLFGAGASRRSQPGHSGLITLLGVVKVRFLYSVIDTCGVIYMTWELA